MASDFKNEGDIWGIKYILLYEETILAKSKKKAYRKHLMNVESTI